MNLPKISEIEKILKTKNKQENSLRCCILRNISIENIDIYLKYFSKIKKNNLDISYGNFDNIYQDTLANGIINKKEFDFIVVFLWLPTFSDILTNKIKSLSLSQINKEKKRLSEYCKATITNIRKYSNSPILWATYDSMENYDSHSIYSDNFYSFEKVVEELNFNLKKIVSKFNDVFLLNLNKCRLKSNNEDFYNKRFWYSFKSPFGIEGLKYLSSEINKFINNIFAPQSKCIVLDCDNVLWGGILGEVGYNKINLSNDNGDSEFLDFQKEILNLYKTGTILAINSKNNLEDVLEVFKKNKRMILKENHFASIKANWNDKASNLREIAKDLNIGLNSLVFVDDSEFEINLIKKELPEVKTLHLPIDSSENNRSRLISSGHFEKMKITNEDRKKGKMYVDEKKRKKLLEKTTDIKTYLKSLKMKMKVESCRYDNLDRVDQMIQKTNQFNLTTKRIKKNEVFKMIKNKKNYSVNILSLKDKFGDYGICGLSIISIKKKCAYFDIFLMSCRVIGRDVEKAFLIKIMKDVYSKNKVNLFYGIFVPTKKNSQVKNFYLNNGFKKVKNKKKTDLFNFDPKKINSLIVPSYLR